ncbi:MAG: twitching motility protein PilT [Phycisphaerae bacterium]
MTIEDWLKRAREADASDLIFVAGKPPCVYVHARMQPLNDHPLSADELNKLLFSMLAAEQRHQLEETGDLDFAWGSATVGRARINVHRQRGSYAAAIRFINTRIPSFEELSLPPRLAEFAQLPRGLVLVTGTTGSGKSTTLAAMIEYMNERFERHIITLEDPIEFLFAHRKCVIEQREIGQDSPSFAAALRHVVRQKPDVILVGEMRDRETIATALTASETGHLVLGTLHTSSAAQTIERIIDVFEAAHQPQIRVQLANTLRAVICQTLLTRENRPGMAPALEIMVMTPAIRRAIRDGETHLIPGMIETGQKLGMCTLDRSLADLVTSGTVLPQTAMAKAADPEKLEKLVATPGNAARAGVADSPEPELVATGSNGSKAGARPWH